MSQFLSWTEFCNRAIKYFVFYMYKNCVLYTSNLTIFCIDLKQFAMRYRWNYSLDFLSMHACKFTLQSEMRWNMYGASCEVGKEGVRMKWRRSGWEWSGNVVASGEEMPVWSFFITHLFKTFKNYECSFAFRIYIFNF